MQKICFRCDAESGERHKGVDTEFARRQDFVRGGARNLKEKNLG